MFSMVPAMAVILPMRPPFCRYSSVSTEKKGKVFSIRRGIRASTSSRQGMLARTSSHACSTVAPRPRLPLRESNTRTSSPVRSAALMRTRLHVPESPEERCTAATFS